jgi:hypothetical protein
MQLQSSYCDLSYNGFSVWLLQRRVFSQIFRKTTKFVEIYRKLTGFYVNVLKKSLWDKIPVDRGQVVIAIACQQDHIRFY